MLPLKGQRRTLLGERTHTTGKNPAVKVTPVSLTFTDLRADETNTVFTR